MVRTGLVSVFAICLASCAPQLPETGSKITPQQAPEDAVELSSLDDDAFHESIAVFDSHLDTPALFHTPDYVFTERGSFEEDGTHAHWQKDKSLRPR